MSQRTRVLQQLIQQRLYPVDEAAVAEAILARAAVRRAVPEVDLRASERREAVRSFRPDARARSFRLAASRRPGAHR
ncbi:MAG TPA: hypothetical protein VD931_03205 [Baekduia sp.]|nr:hypothetical protein [Baekduia sp.]